jgi:DNA repair protein RadC
MKPRDVEQATIDAALTILRRRSEAGTRLDPDSAALDAVLSGLRLTYADRADEHMGAIWLDARRRLLTVDCLAVGSVGAVAIPYRGLARAGLAVNAETCILWHTHPGGDPAPSGSDLRATDAVSGFLHRLDIALLDHVVIALDGTRSIVAELAHRAREQPPPIYSGSADVGARP